MLCCRERAVNGQLRKTPQHSSLTPHMAGLRSGQYFPQCPLRIPSLKSLAFHSKAEIVKFTADHEHSSVKPPSPSTCNCASSPRHPIPASGGDVCNTTREPTGRACKLDGVPGFKLGLALRYRDPQRRAVAILTGRVLIPSRLTRHVDELMIAERAHTPQSMHSKQSVFLRCPHPSRTECREAKTCGIRCSPVRAVGHGCCNH